MNFTIIRDDEGNINRIETNLVGDQLLFNHHLNKDTAFTKEERKTFGLSGKLPSKIETIDEQVKRCYFQFKLQPDDIAKYIYLSNLRNRNETLFYKLVDDNIEEMMPIIYTPTVGSAIEQFSSIYRQPKGLIISYPDKDNIEEILNNYERSNVDLIVVSDAEAILGIGDQGVGGIYICIGKLTVYTICAEVNPHRALPIMLDVGTDNEKMLQDSQYLGWRHKRIRGKEYNDFIDAFVLAVRKKFPTVYLHWEDFGKDTARSNLERYQDKMCTFNDDMQGTGIVALSALLSATMASGQKLIEQKIVFLGAGTAATGIADQICDAMVLEGLSIEEARSRIWMIDICGLLMRHFKSLGSFQAVYAKSKSEVSNWDIDDNDKITLLEVIKNVKPTALIGCSTATKAFTKEIIETMAKYVEYPIVFPLSNPTSKAEAIPEDVLKWTHNKALIATGSPFAPVDIGDGKKVHIAQCNNAYAFPGLGLGIIASKAKRVTKEMLWEACKALTACSPIQYDRTASLLPSLKEVKKVSFKVAKAVIKQAIKDGVTDHIDDIDMEINKNTWSPKYYIYKKK